MSRAYRWQTWLPRLLAVVVILLAAQYGLGLITRRAVIQSVERAIGSRVELAHARVSLLDRQIVLRNLRVTDPRQPTEYLVEADCCELDFSPGTLLHKQAVIEQGVVSGLRFRTPREASGALTGAPTFPTARSIQWFNDEVNNRTQDWIEHVQKRFDPEIINQFETIRKTAALGERLPQQMASLDERVRELSRRADDLQASVQAALANPLRHDEKIRTTPEAIAALKRDYAQLAAEIDRLPGLLDADRRAIDAARRQDEEWLREQLQVPPIDASALNAYLLSAQVNPPLNEIVEWLRLGRRLSPAKPAPAALSKQRGEDIIFEGCDRRPGLLIRSLALHGSARFGGQLLQLRGMLSNFASTPRFHHEPMWLRLKTTGSLPLVLQATIDRTGAVARDELLVDCQNVNIPQACLGKSDELRLSVAPSIGALSISVILDGEKLTGEIQLVQKRMQIAPQVNGNWKDVPLTAALDESLGDVTAMATRLSLSGTLDQPTCALWSNLGPAVAEALDGAFRRAADEQTVRLTSQAQQRVDQQLAELVRQLSELRANLLPQLAQAAGQLEEIAAQQKSPRRISPEQLGRRLPANSLFH